MRKSNIIMYTTEDGPTKIETTFDNDTVWLSLDGMARLFQRDSSVIGKHVRNIFKDGELSKDSVSAKFAYTASDGKTYQVTHSQALEKAHREFELYKNKLCFPHISMLCINIVCLHPADVQTI